MGKGDKKSKRGKIIRGSYGVRRRHKVKHMIIPPVPEKAAAVIEEPKQVKAVPKTVKAKTAPKAELIPEVITETLVETKVPAKAKPKSAPKSKSEEAPKKSPKKAPKKKE